MSSPIESLPRITTGGMVKSRFDSQFSPDELVSFKRKKGPKLLLTVLAKLLPRQSVRAEINLQVQNPDGTIQNEPMALVKTD